jgi:uncharacterized protein (TIGR02569 family)
VPRPSPEVLDLFAVDGSVESLPGGRGDSVHVGDLVLSPRRDAAVAEQLSPVLARLAVRLDSRPGREARDLRLAVPVPARDGSWVVEGWGASRYEPGTTTCRDLDVILASGRLLHAVLAGEVPSRPDVLADRQDRWATAERWAFGPVSGLPEAPLVPRIAARLEDVDLGPDQLVHADLAGNVLLDAYGAPVVIDVSPAWRPTRWAQALCVLDATAWLGADTATLAPYRHGVDRQAMLRALLFRVLSDPDEVVGSAYEAALGVVGA